VETCPSPLQRITLVRAPWSATMAFPLMWRRAIT